LERLGPKIPIKATAEPMGLPGVKRRTVYGYVLATVIVMQIPAKTSEAVQNVIKTLHTEFSSHFSNVFNSITADNGSEFDDFALVEEWSPENYFAHTYSSWNGL
jgi:IS30 family transposase